MSVSLAKRIAVGLGGWLVSSATFADYALNLQPPVTEVARQVYDLHMLVLWIVIMIAVGTYTVMFYSIYKHRKSQGAQPAQFHESTLVETIWTIIPVVILVIMAVPATKTLIAMEETESSKPDVTIKITGSQFKWKYDYQNEDISFISALSTPESQITGSDAKGEHYLLEVDNPVVVPVGKRIRFVLTATDVIHAWWVPAIGIKKDAIPGFVNLMWTQVDVPGVYRGQCAELCGSKHGFMPIVLDAKTPEDYEKWVAEKQAVRKAEQALLASGQEMKIEELMEKGEKVYNANCAVCHQATGLGMATFPPLKGSPVATSGPVENHIKLVLKGGTKGMPSYAASLNDIDLAAVITYERNAWGNNTGQLVQPKDVTALRE